MLKLKLILMVTLLVSSFAFADGIQPEGTGTEADPNQVATLDNLLWISTNSDSWDCWFLQTANIDADPLFCDPDVGDYRLQENSPCIKATCGAMGATKFFLSAGYGEWESKSSGSHYE
jgi:hypothetical protein